MAPRLMVKTIALSERPVQFRTPFRFGAVTVESAPQLFVHAEVEVEGYGRSVGATPSSWCRSGLTRIRI